MNDTTIEQSATVTMIDPDGGWKYGFPKQIPDDHQNDLNPWLIENGYPEFWVNYWNRTLGHVPCRLFKVESTD
jgi:hypothetical protein